jgi:CDP-6-deoxy-D-xylo-4-hexulose-3-dehydrase
MNERELRAEIARLVTEFHKVRSAKRTFVPGKTPVHYAGRVFDEREIQNAVEASLDFWLTAGRFSEEFEDQLAGRFHVEYASLVNSGSSANLVAMTCLTSPLLENRRLVQGDEVITVAAGFPTTVNPILQNGLVPVFVDVELGTYNAIADQVRQAVGPRTRAIFLAHTLGNPFDLDAVLEVAEEHGLFLIEDCCDALGSTYRGRPVGSFGHVATCSFYPAHHITMGEGGAVMTGDEILARAIRSLRDWGRDCYCAGGENNTCGRRFSGQYGKLPYGYDHKYVYSHVGYNVKATDIQAAIGVAQLDKLDGFCRARRENFRRWREGMERWEELFVMPRATEGADPAWFAFPLTVRERAGFGRTDLTDHLSRALVETRNLFGGNLLLQPAYLDVPRRTTGELPNTNRVMNDTFFLGTFPGITSEQIEYALRVVEDFVRSR